MLLDECLLVTHWRPTGCPPPRRPFCGVDQNRDCPYATSAFDSNRTLRAPRRELWYPPSNAMGRFNEAAGPQMALAARVERPRVLAGLHDSTKWPGIPTCACRKLNPGILVMQP